VWHETSKSNPAANPGVHAPAGGCERTGGHVVGLGKIPVSEGAHEYLRRLFGERSYAGAQMVSPAKTLRPDLPL
jgi:hypothetical protein